jgi:hypothetical protein
MKIKTKYEERYRKFLDKYMKENKKSTPLFDYEEVLDIMVLTKRKNAWLLVLLYIIATWGMFILGLITR